MKRILIVLTLAAVVAGCSTDKSTNPTIVPDAAYPTAIGTQWVYERVNETWELLDTFTITIERDSIASDDAKIYIASMLRNGDRVQTRWLRIQGDTLEWLVPHVVGKYRIERYVLPLSLGARWQVVPMYIGVDSMYVVDRDLVTVPLGTFNQAYVLSRYITDTTSGTVLYTEEQHFVPGYGMVRRVVNDMDSEETWELLRFHSPK